MDVSYQDAMSIVTYFGKLDLFLTFTCNPKWHDIEENLFPNRTAADRPDLVASFSIKIKEYATGIISW